MVPRDEYGNTARLFGHYCRDLIVVIGALTLYGQIKPGLVIGLLLSNIAAWWLGL